MSVRSLVRFAASLALAASLAGPTAAQAPPPPPVRQTAPVPFQVMVVNRAATTLMYLYLAPTSAAQWGDDRLGSAVVRTGERFPVRVEAGPCRFDMRAQFDDGREQTRFDVDLCALAELPIEAASSEPLPERADVLIYRVVNGASRDAVSLQVFPQGQSPEPVELLVSGPLVVSGSYTGRMARPADCRFDVTASYQGNGLDVERQTGLDVCSSRVIQLAGSAAADPANAIEVAVTNSGQQTLFILYLRPAGTTDWGPDRFGSDVVPPGGNYRVRLDRSAGCVYDVRLIYEDRREETREGTDLCAAPTLAFTGPAETRRTPSTGGTFDVTVSNRSGVTLYALFLRPAGTQNWSRDMLGSSVVENGRDFRLRVNRRAGCSFEARLVFTDRSERLLPAQDLCATPQIAVSAPDPAQSLQVRVVNQSPQILYAMFLRRSGTSEWGPDRFGSEVVQLGQTFRLTVDRAAGCDYDVRMIYADRSNNRSEEVRSRVDLCASPELAFTGPTANARGRGRIKEQTESQEAPAQISEVTIVNRSAVPIENFHASSSRVNEWLADRLTDGVIAPGAERTFQIERDGQCDFDLRVTYVGGREERRMRVNICTTPRFAFMGPDERLVDGGGPPDGRLVTVVNAGPIELRELYMTSVDDTHWGDDRLGASTLPRRWRVELRVPTADGCRYDVRAVFRSGAALERRNVDICAEATIRFEQRHSPGSLVSTGTGFYVSPQGHILTNQHVVDGCSVIALFRPGQPPVTLRLVAEDERADLALLQQEGARPTPLAFRAAAQPVRAGERVVVIGYPVRQELGGVNVTEGLLSAVRGQRGDVRRFQYSAPTQPGNSGGPVFDESGQVIGVVVSQLAGLGEDRSAQNINFGIALSEVRSFLEANGVTPAAAEAVQPQRPADLLDRVGPSVVPLDCLG